jgi:hypothetical protein
MWAKKTVQYKPPVGAWRKMPWDTARNLVLAHYDSSPIKGSALMEALNSRLKGATIQQFLAERELATRCSH